jgi:hypothetical protein
VASEPNPVSIGASIQTTLPLKGNLLNRWPTPAYALAWVCSREKILLIRNLGRGERGKVHSFNYGGGLREMGADSGFEVCPCHLSF